ncbi:MAG: hypothetical protein KF823_11505 [Xanthomonadales bacterium]|nr:hypothetical protein [Xanthomonadales bacterium]
MTPAPPLRNPGLPAGGRMRWLACTLVCALTSAGQAGGLAIDQAVVAGGGARSTSAGGCLSVTATLGQEPVAPASGGGFAVAAGLWPALAGLPGDALFIDGFQECL